MASGGDDNGTKVITLITSDNERFEVSEAVASLSKTIRNMIDDDCADGGIPLPNVSARVLAKVLEYCNKHAAAAAAAAEAAAEGGGESADGNSDKELKDFDKEFIDVGQDVLYDLLLAANYLEVKGLLDLACQKVGDMVRGKTPEQIRQTFDIKNDFSHEEEEEIRKENSWAFED